ncbi:MAG: hypothetical protein JWP80_1038 [Pseudomonas sp.]|nr:hypothetical protein [Pseudomonas sp.]
MLSRMHDRFALRTNLNPAPDLDVAAVIGHQTNGRCRHQHFAFGGGDLYVFLRVEGDVVGDVISKS